MAGNSTIAITAGEPAGIGPELVALLAARHRERPFPARLVVIGDREVLAARARRIGLAPRYANYDGASFAPVGGAIEIWHQPIAAPVTQASEACCSIARTLYALDGSGCPGVTGAAMGWCQISMAPPAGANDAPS